jgi:ribonuclease HI
LRKPLVFITVDESCLGNQLVDRDRPGGAAGLLEHWKDDRWVRCDYWVSEPATTNNRMALRSAIEALRHLKRPSRLVLTSDSEYLIQGMKEWVHGWQARGWKRKGGDIKNEELWRELVDAWDEHEIEPRWIRGHAGDPRNEYADHLATNAARLQTMTKKPVPSSFPMWLERQREKRERFFDFNEWAPPPGDDFKPARSPND